MLMYVITSPRGSARCGKEWSCRAESIFALKGINLKIVHSEAVHCYMGYFETYILPIIFFMYGGILSLTFSHLYHYWHFHTMVGFCHGGNMPASHDDDDHDDDCGHLRSSLNASLCCKTSQSVVKTFSTQTLINKCSFQKNQRWKHRKEKRHLFNALFVKMTNICF